MIYTSDPPTAWRTVQPSSPAGIDDSFWLVQRGDVGRPPESSL